MRPGRRISGCMKFIFCMYSEYKKDQYTVSTDPARLNLAVIHGYLKRSYWSKNIPCEIVEKCVRNSFCFGVYDGDTQIGFARVVTDFAAIAYLADVFILETHQGKGLGKWLVECIVNHPKLRGLRKWVLVTKDAHGLYEKFGFRPLKDPGTYMEIKAIDAYE